MTAIDYAAMIERLRGMSADTIGTEAADAIELLTQRRDNCTLVPTDKLKEMQAEIARLIADRDSWESNCKYHMRLSQERDGMISELREQRPVAWMLTVGDYIITSHQTARPDDQDDWKPLYSQPATSQSTNRETLFDAHASQVDREIGE